MTKPRESRDAVKLLSTQQVAEMLGVTEQCLRRWRQLGTTGPTFIKLGERFVRYRLPDVEKWLDKHSRTPVSVG